MLPSTVAGTAPSGSGPDALTIGKRIRYRRRRRGATLDDLSALVGISASALSLIETGKREAKVSVLSAIADALHTDLGNLLNTEPPSRRASLEIELERAQRSADFEQLGVAPVRPGPRLPMDALEALVALHSELAAVKAERDTTPEYARRANADLRARMRASDNYFPDLERAADDLLRLVGHEGGPLTRHGVNRSAAAMGFTLHTVTDLPSSTRTVTDLAGRRIFLPPVDGPQQRTLALAALGHIALGHQPPRDYAEFLAQRVEVNYFAGAALVPERGAAQFLRAARERRDIDIEELRDHFRVSDEMAAHRFTNLATQHLDIPVHFTRVNSAGVIYKAYSNDGVQFPADPSGSVEGQRVCRYWTARQVFEQANWSAPYQQYTDTPTGTFWCTAIATRGSRESTSVAVGTPYEHVKWFRGRGTPHRARSDCPDPSCCSTPPRDLAARWEGATWPSARVQSDLLAALPAGAFPGVDQTEVLQFLDRQSPR